MTKDQRLRIYAKQWETAAELLRGRVTLEAYEKITAYLLGRDTLAESPVSEQRVAALDATFAEAFHEAEADWWRVLTHISLRCGFYSSPWWQSILRAAVEEPAPLQKAAG